MKTIELSKAIEGLAAITEMNGKIAEAEKKAAAATQKATEAAQVAEKIKAEGLNEPVDSIGNAKALSVDFSELPTVCGSSMVIKAGKAPDVTPDFIGQVYIDTKAKKVYQAAGVENAGDFKALN